MKRLALLAVVLFVAAMPMMADTLLSFSFATAGAIGAQFGTGSFDVDSTNTIVAPR